jgi:hypothetical protein
MSRLRASAQSGLFRATSEKTKGVMARLSSISGLPRSSSNMFTSAAPEPCSFVLLVRRNGSSRRSPPSIGCYIGSRRLRLQMSAMRVLRTCDGSESEADFSLPTPRTARIGAESVNSFELLRMSIRRDRIHRPRNILHSIRIAPAEKYCPSLQPLSQLDKSHRSGCCFRP